MIQIEILNKIRPIHPILCSPKIGTGNLKPAWCLDCFQCIHTTCRTVLESSPQPLNSSLPLRHFLLHPSKLLDISPAPTGNFLGQSAMAPASPRWRWIVFCLKKVEFASKLEEKGGIVRVHWKNSFARPKTQKI